MVNYIKGCRDSANIRFLASELPIPKWTVQDRYGNYIYFTGERWQHILESRPELGPHFDLFLETLRRGRRQQDSLIPNEYRYYQPFDELLPENSHLVVIVVFKRELNDDGEYIENNFVVTGWANYLWSRG
ncbi:MAG: hypothetical protein KJZ86_13220 [Caldilineaceae bacterium]|nr:hypothetical protein [Caldilineaceae bacterium]HRJ42571.1 hypothetical protein [Caldilineaceae bacterium]